MVKSTNPNIDQSQVRLRVGNTDAEGRMAMVDVLCHAKEKALKDPSMIFEF